jgi:2-polyprenyl-6-methoxyphenol hydroxylase-like FAD-dependent oxidoreductase
MRFGALRRRTSSQESFVDVLVIGSEPCGLISALGLSRAGICVKVVDHRPDQTCVGGGDRLTPDTLGILKVKTPLMSLLSRVPDLRLVIWLNR